MKTFFKNKFDFVVSIGQGCASTSYLRRCNLQNFSYPFDWIAGPQFDMITDFIINGFQDFLNINEQSRNEEIYKKRREDVA